jgi:hypothetical protein
VPFTGAFTPTTSWAIDGLNAYVSPHRQFVYDSTVSGATVPSGLFVSGSFVPTGADFRIDFQRGELLTTTGIHGSISGVYCYKEVNLYFNDKNAQQVLFESRFVQNPRNNPPYTGYQQTDVTYPCILIQQKAGTDTKIAMDELYSKVYTVRLTFLADTKYLYKAVTSIIRDRKGTFIPIFQPSEMPFDYYFTLQNGFFDYSTEASAIQQYSDRMAYIKDVQTSEFLDRINQTIGPNIFGAFIDLKLELLQFVHNL